MATNPGVLRGLNLVARIERGDLLSRGRGEGGREYCSEALEYDGNSLSLQSLLRARASLTSLFCSGE